MATYQELLDQAQKLMAEAENLREKEISKVIAEIRELMKSYGLTVRDIAGDEPGVRKRAGKKAAKYRGPNGEVWSGGRGRKPRWVVEILEQGKSIEDFRV